MNDTNDTIAAIATATGEAGIAVIRISGPASLAIADAVVRAKGVRPSSKPGGSFLHGYALEHPTPVSELHPTLAHEAFGRAASGPEAETAASGQDRAASTSATESSRVLGTRQEHADEVLCLIFRGPHSYTGEDTVELQCHGGRLAAERVLKAVLSAGARVAAPGEFTRRAFLNGRIDLLQAEAVLDLIRARTDAAANMALRQLDGALTIEIQRSYDRIVSTLADLESNLDFADGEAPDLDVDAVVADLDQAIGLMRNLAGTSTTGRLLREGALLVIAGQPNAGKSTLMNRVLRHERSIVSDTPGTTRDVVEDTAVIDGVAIRVADTAGLRDAVCVIEQEGIRRAVKAMEAADLILYVVDGSYPPSPDDLDRIREAGVERTILVKNKSDLPTRYTAPWETSVVSVECSARDGTGVDSLLRMVGARLGSGASQGHPVMVSERHREILAGVLAEMTSARTTLMGKNEEGQVLAASHLHSALDLLGTITGKNYTEDLLDSIFSKFCIGK